MSGGWKGSSATNRSAELPDDWPAIRQAVLERDGHRCVWTMPSGARCPNGATDVDHIRSKWNHSLSNLRSLCGPHHDKRSAAQGAQKAAELRALPPRRRASRNHPFNEMR